MRWACRHIDPDSLELLRKLPEQRIIHLGNPGLIRLVHGRMETAFDGYYPEQGRGQLESDLEKIEESVLICGHTHCPWVFRKDGKLVLNPRLCSRAVEWLQRCAVCAIGMARWMLAG
jgi:predicted phosphodiesterase